MTFLPLGLKQVSADVVFRVGTELLKPSGKVFRITEDMAPVYKSLHDYFHGIEGEIPFTKGICIVGGYGTGKTTAFRVFHKYLTTYYAFTDNLFVPSSVEDLIAELNQSDWINQKLTYNKQTDSKGAEFLNPRHVLINEFGNQYDIKSYGTDVNQLIEAWLMKRYDIFQQHGKVVHVTTNFGTTGLKNAFHAKLIDRFKEMFHFIKLDGESFRGK